MKKHLTIFACAFLSMIGFAQNKANLVIFSEDLEPFYVYVNGIKQNSKPETNVRIADITPNISLRVEFENKALPVIKQNMSLQAGFEHSARLKKDKNQVMKLRYFGQVPLEETVADKSVNTVNYHTADTPVDNNNATNSNNTSVNGNVNTIPVNSNVSITSSTTSTKVNSGNKDNSMMNVTMPGININMNVSDPMVSGDVQTTTTTSQTITTNNASSSMTRNDSHHHSAKPAVVPIAQTADAGCTTAMGSASFTKMKESIDSKPFSDTKLSTAKVATKNACLSVAQVVEIAKLFHMDEDKLTYVKYAYDHCIDKASYYQVSEVFSFSSTTDEFNKFLDK